MFPTLFYPYLLFLRRSGGYRTYTTKIQFKNIPNYDAAKRDYPTEGALLRHVAKIPCGRMDYYVRCAVSIPFLRIYSNLGN